MWMSLARRSRAVKITVSTKPHDGAHARFARELLHRNVFVAVFFVADDLQRETFGGLVEHALRLLGALQQVADLGSGGDA